MGKRSSNGMGTVYERDDGRWYGQVRLGFGPDGKPLRPGRYGKSEEEVVKKLQKLMYDAQQGLPVAPERQTVKHFLTRWLEDSAKVSLEETTYALYESHVRVHLIPGLGRNMLQNLGTQQIQAFVNLKARSKAPRTVRDIHAVLHVALGQAVDWGLVVRNAADGVKLPKVKPKELNCLDPEGARKLLEAVRGERLEALYTVALSLGLRRGEALGLRWQDVNLERGVVHVRQALKRRKGGGIYFGTPKTETSRKPINLPKVTVAALKAHRVRQIEERLAAGIHWIDMGLVFTTKLGTPLDPRSYARQFERGLQKAKLPHMAIHDLRHTAISMLIAQKVDPKQIQDFARHAKITTTFGIYGHVFESSVMEPARMMDEMLGGGQGAG